MSHQEPTLDDYLTLFALYGDDLGALYLEPSSGRYALLFEQAVRLLARQSPFNQTLPAPFRRTAHRYKRRDGPTLERLADPEIRHFMLCDLHDFVRLCAARRRRAAE